MSILANENTKIMVQGITGREASTFARESIEYGAQVVAGVTPGKGGALVHGIPVYDCVRDAVAKHGAIDASVISVPAPAVKDAAIEAIHNQAKLVVIVTERVPRRDVVEILQSASEHGARVVGPNCLGVISPGKTRVGMAGGSSESIRRAYIPGPVGIMSRSGGMTTEIASLLTINGIGQSTCVSLGGDPIVGSTYLDLLPLYEADPQTQAIVIFCEPGGMMEERLAEHLLEHGSRLPVIAFIAGRFADKMQGIRFGHAGAIVEAGRGSPAAKAELLRKSGILVADKLSAVPDLVMGCLMKSRSGEPANA